MSDHVTTWLRGPGAWPAHWLPQGRGAEVLTPSHREPCHTPAQRPGYPFVLPESHHLVPRTRLSLFLLELKSPWKNLDISLGSGGGRRRPICQATTYSQGSVLCQKPYQVQSNLASPRPCLALALKDTTGQPGDTGLWQQSNLQLPAGRSQGRTRESFAQQSNLCFQRTASPHLQKNRLSPAGPSSHQRQTHQVTGTPCLDSRLSGGLKPLDGCTWPNPSPCCGPGSWAPRLVGQPLTLEDLSVSAHSQSWAHFRSACSTDHRLLDSIHHLEPEATCSRSQTSQEHPGPTQRGPPTGGSQSTPAQPWPSHPRESVSLLETLGVQAGLSESPLYKPLSHEAIPTLGTLAGDFSDPNKEVLSTEHLGVRERGSPGLPYNQRNRGHFRVTREAGSREARPESPTFFSVLPGQEGREKAPPEKAGRDGKKMASCPSNGAPAQNTPQVKVPGCRGGGTPRRRAWLELSLLLFSLRTVMAFVSAEQGSKHWELRSPGSLVRPCCKGVGVGWGTDPGAAPDPSACAIGT